MHTRSARGELWQQFRELRKFALAPLERAIKAAKTTWPENIARKSGM